MDVEKYLEEKAPLIDKAIEKYIPRKFSQKAVLFKITPPRFGYNVKALDKAIAEPVWDILDRGGKRWRPALFLLVCEALGKKAEDYLDFAIIPEVVHNGTLIIDDLEDSSDLRRGKPCTYRIYDVDIAVNAGNAMYYLPLLPLMEKRALIPAQSLRDIYEVYVQEMINLSMGQAMDIAWHKGIANADNLEEDDYLQMCLYKTGTLARMAARLAAVIAGANNTLVEKLGRFAESIGVAFQMQDDVLDLTGKEFAEKKGGRGQDITEGKRTLSVIHTLKKANKNDKKRLVDILSMHTSHQTLRDEAITIMRKYNSIDHVRQTAVRIVQESWTDVEKSLADSEAKEKLKAFAEFLVKRSK
ncbi:MAG TPA: polyprenyl synthetase family protein [Candidatus Bathyarchaeia archaeon]